MRRTLLYLSTLLAFTVFYAVELAGNYADYTHGSPIFLKDKYVELFDTNRIALLVTELAAPLIFLACLVVLLILKLRTRGIRFVYLPLIFVATEFWMVRAFIFPDRMLRYYQMSDPEYYMHVAPTDPFLAYFIVHAVLFVLLLLVREYDTPPADEMLENPRLPDR